MQINKEDIKDISYDYKQSKMIIKLKEKRVVNNFMTDEAIYNCSEKVFKGSVLKWLS